MWKDLLVKLLKEAVVAIMEAELPKVAAKLQGEKK